MSEEVPAWSRDDAAAAYVDAMRGILTVAQDLDHDEWHRPTDLPGWAVFDVVAHVAATEDELAGRGVPSPIHDWSLFPHVSSPFQQYTEVGVEARRHLTPGELIDELAGLVDERGQQLAHAPEAAYAEMRGPAGMVERVSRVMANRTFDIWAHEQDVRRATGRSTRMSGPAAAAAQARMIEALPYVVARQAGAPAGSVVAWNITGEPDTTATIQVDRNGRGQFTNGTARPDAVLTLTLESLQLLMCGRRPYASVAVDVHGDADLGERVISALVVTP
jgi:uncharacterized protein (TIGR03083 family)